MQGGGAEQVGLGRQLEGVLEGRTRPLLSSRFSVLCAECEGAFGVGFALLLVLFLDLFLLVLLSLLCLLFVVAVVAVDLVVAVLLVFLVVVVVVLRLLLLPVVRLLCLVVMRLLFLAMTVSVAVVRLSFRVVVALIGEAVVLAEVVLRLLLLAVVAVLVAVIPCAIFVVTPFMFMLPLPIFRRFRGSSEGDGVASTGRGVPHMEHLRRLDWLRSVHALHAHERLDALRGEHSPSWSATSGDGCTDFGFVRARLDRPVARWPVREERAMQCTRGAQANLAPRGGATLKWYGNALIDIHTRKALGINFGICGVSRRVKGLRSLLFRCTPGYVWFLVLVFRQDLFKVWPQLPFGIPLHAFRHAAQNLGG